MGWQTVVSVPDWAQATVQAYANNAWNLSQGQGGAPIVSFTTGSGAVAYAVLSGSTVASVNIVSGGANYVTAPTVTISSSNNVGSGATATATITNGVVTNIAVGGGSGYTATPFVSIQPIGAGAAATATISGGQVSNLTIVSGGANYTIAPKITILGGSGTGATATCTISTATVSALYINSGGSGYTNTATLFASYSGVTTAPQNASELAGINNAATRGSGNATISDAVTLVDNIINGSKLTSLPASLLSKIQIQEATGFSSVSALIGKKAFYTGDTDTTFLAQNLVLNTPTTYNARLAAKIQNDNYKTERVSMDNALGLGINLASQSVTDAELLRNAGVCMRSYTQSTYEIAHKLFIEQQEFAVFELELFGNCLRAMTGSQQSTSSTDNNASALMQAVGIASSVAGLGKGIYDVGSMAGLWGGTAASAASAAGSYAAGITLTDVLTAEIGTDLVAMLFPY
jgi:hypothetical protein